VLMSVNKEVHLRKLTVKVEKVMTLIHVDVKSMDCLVHIQSQSLLVTLL